MLLLVFGLGLMAAAVVLGREMATVAMVVALVAAIAAWHRTLLRWPVIVGLLISIMLFVPVGRYSISIDLPFGLELYRLTVALVLACWFASLLVDSSVRLRRSPFDRALALVVCATLASIAFNPGRVAPLQGAVLKTVTFFLSFVLLYFFVVSVVRGRGAVENLTKLLVAGAAVVAVFATLEQRTGFNIFDRVGNILPFLRFDGAVEIERFGVVRAVGSSAHPIELGVVLAMALPLGLALVFSSSSRWWIPTGALAVGVMTSVSRTPLIVLAAGRPGPAVAATTGRQEAAAAARAADRRHQACVTGLARDGEARPSSRRAAWWLSTLHWRPKPIHFWPGDACGCSARVSPRRLGRLCSGGASERDRRDSTTRSETLRSSTTSGSGLLLEIGIVGVVGWAALFTGAARRLTQSARRRAGPDGWLFAGFAAAIIGFAVAMFTFDAMAFVQVTFMLWILIGLSASLLLAEQEQSG